MAQQATIQYVKFYTAGTAARKIEVSSPVKPIRKPRVAKQQKIVLRVDPLAMVGTLTALVLLVLIVVGMFQVQTARERNAEMAQYVQSLKTENRMLQTTYDNGYDLKQVEETALALGMVPAEQVQQIPIPMELPQTEQPEENFWTNATAFLTGLFA